LVEFGGKVAVVSLGREELAKSAADGRTYRP